MQSESQGTHPCLLSYGTTDKSDLPLILVVGREPNGTSAVGSGWGTYDFYEKIPGNRRAGSPFWDGAYGVMGTASTPSIDTKGFKALVAARGLSPIIFADALPHGIDNAVRKKAAQRLALSTADIEAHVASVFSHKTFINRVRIVLLSGLGEGFERSSRIYEDESRRRNIPFQHLPFFAGQNIPQIRNDIRPETWAILRSIATDLAERPMRAAV